MNCQFSSRPGPGRATLPRSRNCFFDHGSAGASPCRLHRGQRGVALVITLVLLVVITTLAVAFLALSYRETASVAGVAATTDAGHAADTGLERAQAQMKAQIIHRNRAPNAGSDVMGPDLMISVARDVPDNVPNFRLNVWSNHWANRVTLDGVQADAAAPVFVWLAKASNSTAFVQLRDYLDLNRNGRFEPTGFLTNLLDDGSIATDANGPIVEWRVGDPQWISILRDPTRPHGPDNHFIARYAFIILPAGRSLDVNWIHNQAVARGGATDWTVDGFFRNQGVGAYELNLAAFLADVNSNYWNDAGGVPYQYQTDWLPNVAGSLGDAFTSAREFLQYRYAGSKQNPASATRLFASLGPLGVNYFPLDYVDAYANGPLAPFGSSVATAQTSDMNDDPLNSWPGADSRAHFFTLHDFWDAAKLPGPNPPQLGFRSSLIDASLRGNSHDRYTYYRILAQLGTDSPAERDDRMNVNYRTVTNASSSIANSLSATRDYTKGGLVTNLVPWTAHDFFHTAADRLLTNEFFPYGITNIGLLEGRTIPIYAPTGAPARLSVFGYPITNSTMPGLTVFTNSIYPLYSPRIHQLLQLAVNIYEATQPNDTTYAWPTLPTVMRPLFERRGGEVHITAYKDETGVNFQGQVQGVGAPMRWYELDDTTAPLGSPGSPNLNANFYDIPILFGARKGFPSFSEFTTHSMPEFIRKLEIHKNTNSIPGGALNFTATNQTLIINLTNYHLVEFNNPYGRPKLDPDFPGYPAPGYAYPRPVDMVYANNTTTLFTNDGVGLAKVSVAVSTITGEAKLLNPAIAPWTNGFRLTGLTNVPVVTSSVLYVNTPTNGLYRTDLISASEVITGPLTNRWGMVVSNRLRAYLFDGGRLIDCFTSARMNSALDISAEMEARATGGSLFERQWLRRPSPRGDVSQGVQNQIDVSIGRDSTSDDVWKSYGFITGAGSADLAIAGLQGFFLSNAPNSFVKQAGFTPRTRLLHISTWQANDPLVHYTVYDLYQITNKLHSVRRPVASVPYNFFNEGTFGDDLHPNDNATRPTPGLANDVYNSWGGKNFQDVAGSESYEWAKKDPGVVSADQWDFPTQRFPGLGWLGRVHRGTPWQTVYLKADNPTVSGSLGNNYAGNVWWQQAGAAFMPQTFPTNDWRLLDLFTAAIHPNATRGRLSINQTNLAAWSAVFSGVPASVMTNNDPFFDPVETTLQPHSVDLPNTAPGGKTPLLQLVEGINRTRGGKTFSRLADFMAVPELTFASPFLPGDDATQRRSRDYFATDADYEKIPQQILSLVKVGEPRYVVYAWGQSLKPADYTPGIGIGIDPATKVPRNYQITGELATRSVVRVEFDRDANGRTRYERPRTVTESFNILPNE